LRSFHKPISPRFGIYEVESFVESGKARVARFGDSVRWRRVIVNENGTLSVQTMDDAVVQWRTMERPQQRLFELTGTIYPQDRSRKAVLRYSEPEPDQIVLEGVYDGRAIQTRIRRTQLPSFVLLDRGFHWINEHHYNR
jgi:hypothetical protein